MCQHKRLKIEYKTHRGPHTLGRQGPNVKKGIKRGQKHTHTHTQYTHTYIHIHILEKYIHLYIYSLRRKWQPTQVFLPGEFHGQRHPWGCKELNVSE